MHYDASLNHVKQEEASLHLHRLTRVVTIAITLGGLALGGSLITGVAQSATPIPVTTLTLVEHNEQMTDIDVGGDGVGPGDIRVWGPNPLFDEANVSDTGATTQGSCLALNAAFDCVLAETILFPDGSALEMQGLQPGAAVPSSRTIVGGSGRYLGASGTIAVAPTEDLTVWTKTIDVSVPVFQPSVVAMELVLIEHAGNLTTLDLGAPGSSIGDLQVWGPNPLFDATDATDTGATTQGSCIALNAAFDCLTAETIVFPDGSTLQLQGAESSAALSMRTIVGGSGTYLGATGTVSVKPASDQTRWTKTFEIVMPAG